jgi:hypothetical protein
VVAAEDPIVLEVLETTVLVDVLSLLTLVSHASFLHNPPRSRVTGQMSGLDAIQPKGQETVVNHGANCFRGVASAPEGLADPVAELAAGVLELEPEVQGSYEVAVRLGDGEDHVLPAGVGRLMGCDPSLREALTVGMGDRQGSSSDRRGARELLNGRGVRRGKGPKQETGRAKSGLGLLHWGGDGLFHAGRASANLI